MNMVKYGAAVAVVASLIAIGGAFVAVDQRYAHAAEFKKLEMRLEQKILSDRSGQLQERMWKLEDRADKARKSVDTNEMRQLVKDKDEVDQKLKAINQNATGIK